MTPRKENDEEDSENSKGKASCQQSSKTTRSTSSMTTTAKNNSNGASSGNSPSSRSKPTKKPPPQQHHPFSTLLFPMRLHRILSGDTGGTRPSGERWDDLISWSPDGKSFRIHDKKNFEKEITKKYFGTPKLRVFKRNLIIWGFTNKTNGPKDQEGEWFHALFIRDRPELCNDMQREIMAAKQHDYRHEKHSNHSTTSSAVTPPLASTTVQTKASGIADNRTNPSTMNGNSRKPPPPAFAGVTNNSSFISNLNNNATSRSTTNGAGNIWPAGEAKGTKSASRSHEQGGVGYLNHPQGYSSAMAAINDNGGLPIARQASGTHLQSGNLSDGGSSSTTTDDSAALLSAMSSNSPQLAEIIFAAAKNAGNQYQQNQQGGHHAASPHVAGGGMNDTNTNISMFKNNHTRNCSGGSTKTMSDSNIRGANLPLSSKQSQSSSFGAQVPLLPQHPDHLWALFPKLTEKAVELITRYQGNDSFADNNSMGQHQLHQNASVAPQQGGSGEWTEEMTILAILGYTKLLHQEWTTSAVSMAPQVSPHASLQQQNQQYQGLESRQTPSPIDSTTSSLSQLLAGKEALANLLLAASRTEAPLPLPQPRGPTAAGGYPAANTGASSNVPSLVNQMLTQFLASTPAGMNGAPPQAFGVGYAASPNGTGNDTGNGRRTSDPDAIVGNNTNHSHNEQQRGNHK